MRRTIIHALGLIVGLAALISMAPAQAASAQLSSETSSVSWTGSSLAPKTPVCDLAALHFCSQTEIDVIDGGTIDITVTDAELERWDIAVYELVDDAEVFVTEGTGAASFDSAGDVRYRVYIIPDLVAPGSEFEAVASLTPVIEPAFDSET